MYFHERTYLLSPTSDYFHELPHVKDITVRVLPCGPPAAPAEGLLNFGTTTVTWNRMSNDIRSRWGQGTKRVLSIVLEVGYVSVEVSDGSKWEWTEVDESSQK